MAAHRISNKMLRRCAVEQTNPYAVRSLDINVGTITVQPERQVLPCDKRTGEIHKRHAWEIPVTTSIGVCATRLDWTYSALAALWFAVDKEPANVKGKEQDAVVWMLKTMVDDFINEKDRTSPFDRKPTGIYRPRVITQRIAAQGGIFTAHRMMKKEGFVNLEKNIRFRDRLTKFTVEASAFPHIRKHLDGCGVNRSTLFPDLVGLCSHLEWRYTKLPDE